MNNNGKKRLHFGVLLTTIDNACLHTIWTGIAEFARLNDISITAYFGTYQSTDADFTSHLGTCFETIKNNASLDGVLIFTGFIAKHIKIQYFDKQISEFPKHIPVVSISFPMPGIPSVLVDNVSGIFSAVEHLITVHGKKEIAFVKGPDGHPEAEDRLLGYKKALEEYGIAFNEKYVLPGYFSRESGREAVKELFDVRKLKADAIVASDDESAIGILAELKSRGIVVPTDIAVTGFDDDKASAHFTPSISTVHQGLFSIGQVGVEILRKVKSGESVPDITYVDPIFMPRQSCGCFEKEFTKIRSKKEAIPAEGDTLSIFAAQNTIPLFGSDILEDKVQKWVTALIGDLLSKPFNSEKFLHLIDEILINYGHYSQDYSIWYELLQTLSSAAEYFSDEVDNLHAILSTLFYATTLVYDIQLKEEKTNEFHLSDARVHLRRLTSSLIILLDIDTLAEEMHNVLPELSVNTALIGLYRNPVKSDDPDADRTFDTLIGFDGDEKFNMRHNTWNPILFSNYSTIDKFDFDRERRTLFYIPLFFKDEEAGVMLLSYNPLIPIETYETLRISISTAVKGSELLSKIQALSITDELTGLYNRRGFFQFSYARLPNLSRESLRLPFIMFLDMDGLKSINDTYGHNEGDIAIAAFARVLRDALREEDIIGRIGGDEFVVFSSVKSKEDGNHVVRRIREKLDEYNEKKLHPYLVQGSIGSIVLEDTTRECFEAAMLSADSVLYDEKMDKKKKGLSRQ